jgi:succinate dehydrogenase iron-sulfur subunit
MKAILDIYRKKPGAGDGYREKFEIDYVTGDTLLDAFHKVQAQHDPSFAYRYSCRGAICGSCAVRLNGAAALACKTQVGELAEKGEIVVDPLGNLKPVKDLVVDLTEFWAAYGKVRPFIERAKETHDYQYQSDLDKKHTDEMMRTITCIKCASCFSDCPKREEDPVFMGPQAAVQLYRFYFDDRDASRDARAVIAADPKFGVVACDSHANCVKVCPKDVRPLRAINFIRSELPAQE